jgi:hypothetical protein
VAINDLMGALATSSQQLDPTTLNTGTAPNGYMLQVVAGLAQFVAFTGITDGDPRLSDTRTPSPGSVTDSAVAAGAAIAPSKLGAGAANVGQVLQILAGGTPGWGDDPSSGGSTSIADGAVTTAKLADLAVTLAKIADGSVTNAKIATGAAIAVAKLAAGAEGQQLVISGGVPTWVTPTNPARAHGQSTQTPGAVTVVNIAHGLGALPRSASVVPHDVNSRGAPAFYVGLDVTNVQLSFASALAAATQYKWFWSAFL